MAEYEKFDTSGVVPVPYRAGEPATMVPVPAPTPQAQLERLKAAMVPGNVLDLSATLRGIVGVLEAMLGPQTPMPVRNGCGHCPELAFDSHEQVLAHVVREHRGLEERTTRELLAELRMRAENWRGTPYSGTLADSVDHCIEALETKMLDGRREP